jgi:hypothetical protein
MLTADQITDLWERRIGAEVRALYFAEWANIYSTRKQWITGLSFFLSSGAVATLVARLPIWVPMMLSGFVVVITAYSVAVSLDSKIRTMAKLNYSWSQQSADYARLWNQTYGEDAGANLDDLIRREQFLSELAATDAPYDQTRLARWQDHVFQQYHLVTA